MRIDEPIAVSEASCCTSHLPGEHPTDKEQWCREGHHLFMAHREQIYTLGRNREPFVALYCFCNRCGEKYKLTFNDEVIYKTDE